MKSESLRRWVVPIYLILCVVLGGSGQGIWANLVLQLTAIAVLVWAFVARRSDDLTSASRQLMALAAITAAVIAVELVPLPPGVWAALPGRELVVGGYQALGYPLPSLPLSMTPYATVETILVVLPALAVLVATIRIRQRESWLAAALLLAVFAGVVLGALQVASGGPEHSSWYFYPISNSGAVGFFANRNHMGSLLLVSIPFAVALLASLTSRARSHSPRSGLIAFGAAALIVIVAGIGLNRSLAAVGLAVPVLLFSSLILPGWRLRSLALPLAAIGLLGSLVFLTSSPIAAEISGDDLSSFQSRADIWSATLTLIQQSFPVGTGLGSFDSVYPVTEAPGLVDRTYVNHAHNDYLEILLEMGLAGALVILLFLGWWTAQVIKVWRSSLSTYYQRAATIASGALLAHSIVDYPLRTAALSAVFAMCLALMAQPRRERRGADASQARPTRHLTIG